MPKKRKNLTIHRQFPVRLLLVLTCFFGWGDALALGDTILPENKVPGRVESQASRLMDDLQAQGFEVSRGFFKLYTIPDDCVYTYSIMHSCYANNPAAPYVTLAVPPWPGEFTDDKSNLWGPLPAGYEDIFRFDPGDAIVILGRLPPPAAYFSVQTYLFSREGTIDTGEDNQTYTSIAESMPDLLSFLFAYVPGETPDDTPFPRFQSFSMLSNPINNVVIERQSHTAFNQLRYFIITPDRSMNDAVRSALAGIGIKEKDIFTEPIPSDMEIGLDAASDSFTTIIRYSRPVDGGKPGTASSTWRNDLPIVALRVRNTRSDYVPERYPQFDLNDLEERAGVNELGLGDDLGSLLYAVSQRWGQSCANMDCSDRSEMFQDMQTPPISVIGPLCRSAGENCLGDNWDTAYQIYGPRPLDNGEIYAVAGTLGTETGNATYVGFGINYAEIFLGAANLSDKDLKGTAKSYRGKVNNTGKFYLYYLTRDCSGLEDLTGGNCLELTDEIIPFGGHFSLIIRDYIVPGTQRGPDSSLVLPSRVLLLERP